MSLTIQLPHFEGPLALLLYLIRKEEMDIMDIKIHEITTQYLAFITRMKELDVEVAGEFIAMASTLIHIKSRMLLPQYGDNGEIIEQEDPRKELVQKLLEYQKYQEAAKILYERPLVGRDLFLRGVRERLEPKEEEIELEENALFSLISAYRRAWRAAQKRIHKVTAKAQSIASRILEMRDRLIVGMKIAMSELVQGGEGRARQTLITFLSLLELGKMGFVNLMQTETYSEIWVETKKQIEADVISKVEEYENVNAEQLAMNLMAEATPDESSVPAEDFVLTDQEDSQVVAPLLAEGDNFLAGVQEEINPETMATDEELWAAEQNLDVKTEGHDHVEEA